MQVRAATSREVALIAAMSGRVQARLTASGSLQEFGPIPADTVAAHVAAGTAHALDDHGTLIGGAFVEPAANPVTPDLLHILAQLDLAGEARRLWWLQKLMIEPDRQAQRLGLVLLDGIKLHVAARAPALLALDCWAGSTKLRDFYARAGFHLHGEFGAGGFDVAVFTWEAAQPLPVTSSL